MRRSRSVHRRQRKTRRHRTIRKVQRGGEIVEKRFDSVSQLRDFLKEATYHNAFQAKEGALGASLVQIRITAELRTGGGPLTLPKYTAGAPDGTFTITNENIKGLKFLFA